MERGLLSYLLFILVLCACGQSSTNQRAVRLMATVQTGGPSITVRWQAFPGATGYTIHRRDAGATTWGSAIANLPAAAVQYVDVSVEAGIAYEYKVQRTAASTGYGYVRSGIAVPETDRRGRIVLLVESGLAVPLEEELQRLEDDLIGDGWSVLRHDVQITATPASVRALVQADHAAAPQEVKAVFLLGRVPVAYSGNHAPDGHGYHAGAWPCDGYYGEMNGAWTDNTVNSIGSNYQWNHNMPGDGKFDQSDFPNAVELQVGRVDLSRLDAFGTSEVELLRDYLDRAHAWKTAQFTVPATAVVWDNLEWADYPLAVSGYMSAAPCVGIDSVIQLEPSQGQFFQHYLNNNDLFTFHASTGMQGSGPGGTTFPGTENGLSNDELVNNTQGGVFNLSIGSYYGDWDNTDNFLRSMIAKGNALTHVWSGMPNWFLHPMAMGEPIGYCALRSMNNSNSDYSLMNGGWQGQSMGQAHMALMGDPSLRMRYLAPPTALIATNAQWFAGFSWTASPAPVDGYHIYRIDEVDGTITRITTAPVQGTSYISDLPFVPGIRYMVRAIKLVTTPSGSYHDLSLGALDVAEGVLVADCEGIIGGPAIPGTPCDDGDPVTQWEAYDPMCECVAGPIGIGEGSEGEALRIWPSPADGVLHVSANAPGGNYIIRSMDSAAVSRGRLVAGTHSIATASLPSGSYLLEYRPSDHGDPALRRFVVQH